MEAVRHSQRGPCQIAGAEVLQVRESDLAVAVHVEGLEEGVDVLLLRVVVGVEDAVGVAKHGSHLPYRRSTFTESMALLPSRL